MNGWVDRWVNFGSMAGWIDAWNEEASDRVGRHMDVQKCV
jgi:hypothetical protein